LKNLKGGSDDDIFIFWMAISGIKNFEFRILTISDPHSAPFPDMSMGHRIFLQ
jgi:hypothetical protein